MAIVESVRPGGIPARLETRGERLRGKHLATSDLGFTVENRSILDGIELTLEPGERLGVIGPNGSGKSTLLRCLYAWHQPTRGAVFLEGVPLAGIPAQERARSLSVLAQETEPGLGLTIAEVVALGRLPHRPLWAAESRNDTARITAALTAVGLLEWSLRSFATLSGGEKQRVLFARALAQDPSVLILDEPTNHLDIRHQLELLATAGDLGISIVTTLHDLNLAGRWCDRLCLLEQGRIRAIGTPDKVLDPELIGAVYGVEVDRDTDPRTRRPRLTFHLDF